MISEDLSMETKKIQNKYDFDFSNDQPFAINNKDESFSFQWTKAKESVSQPLRATEPKPRMKIELQKPRMSVKHNSFSLQMEGRSSIFGSSVRTESTNITSDSNVSLVNGEFGAFDMSFCRRSSIQFNLPRRQTFDQKHSTINNLIEECKEDEDYTDRPSIGSLNDRDSSIEG